MVSSSFGLSDFKLRGVLSSLRSRPLCPWNKKISRQVPKQEKKNPKQKVAHRNGGGRSPRAIPGQGESCASPRGLLRHSPRLSSWVQRGQAGCAVLNQMRRVQPRWSRCYTTSPGCGAATHVLFGVLEIERKKEELGKGAARWNNCKKRALVDEGLPLYTPSLPLFTWIPWCWLPGK